MKVVIILDYPVILEVESCREFQWLFVPTCKRSEPTVECGLPRRPGVEMFQPEHKAERGLSCFGAKDCRSSREFAADKEQRIKNRCVPAGTFRRVPGDPGSIPRASLVRRCQSGFSPGSDLPRLVLCRTFLFCFSVVLRPFRLVPYLTRSAENAYQPILMFPPEHCTRFAHKFISCTAFPHCF